mmetsp:Transcript_17182/g.52839  ORF Transcript_17182/g.52839 Transcript_17182/m.52839 type:complete len:461 (-) Transcript_17182:37-1419(-)
MCDSTAPPRRRNSMDDGAPRRRSSINSMDDGAARPAKRPRRGSMEQPTKLRVGFVCGKEDGDLVAAPGLPEQYHCAPEPPAQPKKGAPPECHSDLALWWWIKTRYPETIECDLLRGPDDVTAARLERNDVNLLLGWDAVSAHLEEHDGTGRFAAGHGDAKAAILRDPACRVFPPGELQDLGNAKGAYVAAIRAAGLPTAPTAVYECEGGDAEAGAAFAADAASARGWKKFVAKPSPSSWSRGVDAFQTKAVASRPARLEAYFQETAFNPPGAAKQILVQRHLAGLANLPETRCFLIEGEFQYAVANSTHRRGAKFELTSCPESSSSRDLPAKYWRPHAALAKRVVEEVLPPLKTFAGAPMPGPGYAWPVRVDVGAHAAGDLDGGCADDAPASRKRERAYFVNEIELVPTLYLDEKFGHEQDYLARYARSLVKTAFEACGRTAPAPDGAPDDENSLKADNS